MNENKLEKDGKVYEAVETNLLCDVCAFYTDEKGDNCNCLIPESEISCISIDRTDKRNIYWREINKNEEEL